MSIRLRLLLVLCLLLVAFGGALFQLRLAETDHINRIIEGVRDDNRMQLSRWSELVGVPLRQFVSDLVTWRETAAFLTKPDPAWAREQLDENLSVYGLDAVWLLRPDGTIAHRAARNSTADLPALPAVKDLAAISSRPGPLEFFAEDAHGIWQVSGAPVPISPDTHGWLLAARRWDEMQVTHLGQVSDSQVHLLSPDTAGAEADDKVVRFLRPLNDWQGKPLRLLSMEQILPGALVSSIDWDGYVIKLFISFGALLVVALALCVRVWILNPLNSIGESLARHDPAPINPLLQRRDEFRHVAQLVESSFSARRALEHEIAERKHAEAALRTSEEQLRHSVELRARLARDLHDSVIQSIYASGLGLEAVRAQMSKNPFGADGRISHCIASLNETIRLVRNYINDLEPYPHRERQPFSAAVHALARTMHALSPVEIEVHIDETVATRLTPVLEVQSLQIVRECLSNALRHGAATRIGIALRAAPGGAVLEVTDNGRGFDPAQRVGTGRGLVNLGDRAREIGATLDLHSAEGEGTRVTVQLPLPEKEAV
jgi:signal transduction histidine kinase